MRYLVCMKYDYFVYGFTSSIIGENDFLLVSILSDKEEKWILENLVDGRCGTPKAEGYFVCGRNYDYIKMDAANIILWTKLSNFTGMTNPELVSDCIDFNLDLPDILVELKEENFKAKIFITMSRKIGEKISYSPSLTSAFMVDKTPVFSMKKKTKVRMLCSIYKWLGYLERFSGHTFTEEEKNSIQNFWEETYEIVDGEDLIKAYSYVHSCMQSNPNGALGFYAKNKDKVKLILGRKNGDYMRALIWKTKDGWVRDRVYSTGAWFDIPDKFGDIEIIDTLEENSNDSGWSKDYRITLKCHSYYPYMDTFRSFEELNPDGIILSTCGNRRMQEGYANDKYTIDHDYLCDDADEGVWSEFYDDYVPEDDAVWCESIGSYISINDDDFVEINGDYYESSDEEVGFSMYSQEYFLFKSGDFEYVESQGDYLPVAVIVYVNGEPEDIDDCVEIDDEWYLREDCVEFEGQWFTELNEKEFPVECEDFDYLMKHFDEDVRWKVFAILGLLDYYNEHLRVSKIDSYGVESFNNLRKLFEETLEENEVETLQLELI